MMLSSPPVVDFVHRKKRAQIVIPIKIAAAANVTRVPAATASALAVVTPEPTARANIAPIADAPVMSPRLRDRLSIPATTPRSAGSILVMSAVLFAA
jgi:hypothetical protein